MSKKNKTPNDKAVADIMSVNLSADVKKAKDKPIKAKEFYQQVAKKITSNLEEKEVDYFIKAAIGLDSKYLVHAFKNRIDAAAIFAELVIVALKSTTSQSVSLVFIHGTKILASFDKLGPNKLALEE